MWCGAVSAQARCRAVLAYHFTDTGQAEMEISHASYKHGGG